MSDAPVAYCAKCGKDVEFESRMRQDKREVDGKLYVFRRQFAICKTCGNDLVYQPYDNDAEHEILRISSESAGLVTHEQIKELPRRYAIGKRPLSKLLGWGELTYTRLLEGRTPTQEHSDELRRLIEDPAAFARLLEQGHNQGIITDVAYQRSRKALEGILTEEHQASTTLFEVADRLCVLAEGDLTPHALQSLIYFVQGWSTVKLDEPLFDCLPRAASYGAEYGRVKDGYSFANIQAAAERAADAESSLSKEALALVDAVYAKYGNLSGSALRREICGQSPWRKARKRAEVAEGEECNEDIMLKSMRKFFSKESPLGKQKK